MKQKLLFLIGCILLFGIIFFIIKSVGSRSPKQGELRVDSTPTSSVFIDNKHIGRTPIGNATSGYKIDAGEYTIKIAPDTATPQLASWEGKIKINPGSSTYVSATLSESELSNAVNILWLEKISGRKAEISVTTTPDSATVLIDNETKGMTPMMLQDMIPGEHTLTVRSQGFLSRTSKVQIPLGYRLIASIKLALAPGGFVASEVSPTPTGKGTESPTPKTSGKTTPSPSPKASGIVTPTAKTSASPNVSETLADPPKPYALVKNTPTGFLNVRETASTSSTIIGKINPGEKYTIIDEKTGWYQIQYTTNKTGWIASQYAEKVE